MKFKALLLFVSLSFGALQAQDKYTISGTVKDASSGEDLIGAAVVLKDNLGIGAVTNAYGYYALMVSQPKVTLVIQYVGFNPTVIEVDASKGEKLNIELQSQVEALNEVVIESEAKDVNITETKMSVTKISVEDVKKIPVLFGERDVMKTVQLMPGIKTAGEGNSGFYVRGGTADQNLILLDEATVYNPSHLLGFFSVFNSDALKDVTLYKGGMPAEYGGRASSVMDIKMKDGNMKDFGLSGGIGLISSNLTLEGPLQKDKGSFIVSGRRTYADMFLAFSNDETISNSQLYFYDLNTKANYKINENNRVYLSGYFGRDRFGFSDDFGFDWGNATGTFRWNHIFNDRLFSNTSLIYSDYDYEIGIGADEGFSLKSTITDWNLKEDFTYFANNNNKLKFGGNLIYHNFVPGEITASENNTLGDTEVENQLSLEGALYIQNDQKVNDRLSLNYGLRYSYFNYLGEGTAYEFDENGNLTNSTYYDSGESIAQYGGFEPRLSMRYLLNESSSIKSSINRNYQYLHLLSNSTTGTPTDIWVPSSNNVKPQRADQFALGYFKNFRDNMFEFSIEGYYKNMFNLIDYRDGADLQFATNVESELVYGSGKSYGAELLLRKNSGRLTGWVSYTLSRTLREFDDINNGEIFPARQDRIHDISVVGMYDITPKLNVSATWVYYTGDAATFPSGKYLVDGQLIPYYTERNGYRMPHYHRLDIGVNWERKKTEKFESSWNFSLYNAYGRENAYSIGFEQSETDPNVTEAVQLSLFKWVPSFSYNFKF
ncbi:MAG: TonB-dependent receptor [Bacteroidia bacterium]